MGPPEFEEKVELHGFSFLRVSMGNPHAVAFLGDEEEVERLVLREVGPPIERDPLFPEKTNVEFAYARGLNEVRMRIWERGAGETLASGSGSCATTAAAIHQGLAESPVQVLLEGGAVEVEWAGGDEPMYMKGPAEYVCEGDLLL
jgi:diaminopimelate epimerase